MSAFIHATADTVHLVTIINVNRGTTSGYPWMARHYEAREGDWVFSFQVPRSAQEIGAQDGMVPCRPDIKVEEAASLLKVDPSVGDRRRSAVLAFERALHEVQQMERDHDRAERAAGRPGSPASQFPHIREPHMNRLRALYIAALAVDPSMARRVPPYMKN